MPVKYAKRSYKKRPTMKKVVKKAVGQAKKKMFAKSVKQVINRMSETKNAGNYGGVQAVEAYNSALTPPQSTIIDLTSPLDTIAQGTGQGDRIGNKIKLTKFNVKGYISFNSTGTLAGASIPVYIKMIIFKQKLNDGNPDMSRLLHNGNTDIAPTNTLRDMIIPINTDYYTVFATRIFKLGTSAIAGLQNNDYHLTRFFNVSLLKHCKSVTYSDTLVTPQNKKFYCGFLAGYADGTSVPVSTNLANFNFETLINFKDF